MVKSTDRPFAENKQRVFFYPESPLAVPGFFFTRLEGEVAILFNPGFSAFFHHRLASR
jgi:hypothetical protein